LLHRAQLGLPAWDARDNSCDTFMQHLCKVLWHLHKLSLPVERDGNVAVKIPDTGKTVIKRTTLKKLESTMSKRKAEHSDWKNKR
jgi:hypothetical protein